MIHIKAEYNNTVVAFGSNGAVLSKRSQSELVDLGIIALESQDPTLLKFFDDLPSLTDLRRMKLEDKIAQYKKPAPNKPKKVEIKKK